MSKQVFVSYSKDDRERAERIWALLEEQGIECWVAPRDVRPGHDWDEEIIDAIGNTAAMVLILSERSNESVHVKHEVERAVSSEKPVFPVRLQEVLPSKKLALHISTRQWFDAWEPPLDGKVSRLAAAIRSLLRLPEPAESREKGPSGTTERHRQAEAVDAAVRDAVEKALRDTEAKRGSSMYSNVESYSSENSGVLWRPLYDTYKGREVPGLLAILSEGTQSNDTRWKTIAFLAYSMRTSEGRARANEIVDAICDYGLGCDSAVQGGALAALSEASLPPRNKWERLIQAVEKAKAGCVSPIVEQLIQFSPREEREKTAGVIFELLPCASDFDVTGLVRGLVATAPPSMRERVGRALVQALEIRKDVYFSRSAIVEGLKQLKYTEAIPALREMFLTADAGKAATLARLLAEWGDKGSGPAIREAIERYRYSGNYVLSALVKALYSLEEASCADYVAEVLQLEPPALQAYLLNELNGSKDAPIVNAAREIGEMTSDAQLKAAVAKFLGG